MLQAGIAVFRSTVLMLRASASRRHARYTRRSSSMHGSSSCYSIPCSLAAWSQHNWQQSPQHNRSTTHIPALTCHTTTSRTHHHHVPWLQVGALQAQQRPGHLLPRIPRRGGCHGGRRVHGVCHREGQPSGVPGHPDEPSEQHHAAGACLQGGGAQHGERVAGGGAWRHSTAHC
jgi:hypothetical protein